MASILFGVYLALLMYGVFSDVRFRRVPNAIAVLLLLVGFAGTLAGRSEAATLVASVLAVTIGLLLWLPFWLWGLLGAGDVKYFAAACSWLGVSLTWRAAILAALIGGVMSLAVMVWRSGFRRAAETVVVQGAQARAMIANADISGSEAASRTFPYALPMAVAIVLAAFAPDRLLAFLRF